MLKTDTGNFRIGFRRLGFGEWCRDIQTVIAFMKDNDLGVVDLARNGDEDGETVIEAGLDIGSVDLPEWKEMSSPDKDLRSKAVEKNISYIETCSAAGIKNFFCVIQACDTSLPARDSFYAAMESFGELGSFLEKTESWVVIEGCPSLVSTPETYRVFLKECHERMAVNYDPSHLIRMGIDPIRFLEEFAPRVKHIHGKDTEISDEGLYEFGHQIQPILSPSPRCGSGYWRYTIPGQGSMRWRRAFEILKDASYEGAVSIELEDHYFMATEDKQQEGLIAAGRFLESC